MELATPQAFARDPALVSRWYDERRRKSADSEPNPGHLALTRLQEEFEAAGKRFTLITQNVDRLHQRVGSRDLLELHGTFWVWCCTSCGEEREEREIPFPEYPPRCRCGGLRRPGVVWFGETLPESVLTAAWQAAEHCGLFMSLGTAAWSSRRPVCAGSRLSRGPERSRSTPRRRRSRPGWMSPSGGRPTSCCR